MPNLKHPALVVSLNVVALVAIVAIAAALLRPTQAPAPPPIQVQRVAQPPSAIGMSGRPNAQGIPNVPGIPQEMVYAVQASTAFRNGQYAQCMRDSDVALKILRSERQTKETHIVSAQIALIAARAAKASGSSAAFARYVDDVRASASAVDADPTAYQSEKKSVRELVTTAATL